MARGKEHSDKPTLKEAGPERLQGTCGNMQVLDAYPRGPECEFNIALSNGV